MAVKNIKISEAFKSITCSTPDQVLGVSILTVSFSALPITSIEF